MLYEKCSEVSEKFWQELRQTDPEDIRSRTGIGLHDKLFRLPLLDRELLVDLAQHRILVAGAEDTEPEFRVCLIALHYLLYVDTSALGPPLSPLELPGGTTFFQSHGPHALPNKPLEDRFGQDLSGFLEAGRRLKAELRAEGDGALALTVFPGLTVEVILWQADEEFPAQVSFMVPSHLDRFWQLDAVLGLLDVVVRELLKAGDSG